MPHMAREYTVAPGNAGVSPAVRGRICAMKKRARRPRSQVSARAADRDGRGVVDADRNVAGRNRVAGASVRTHPNDDGVDARTVRQRNRERELAVGGNLKIAGSAVGVLLADALDPTGNR